MKSKIQLVKLSPALLSLLLLMSCDHEPQPTPEQTAESVIAQQKAEANPLNGEQIAQQYCVKCHPANGKVNNAELPQINGLAENYLDKALRDYLSGERKHEGMNQTMEKLEDQQIIDVASYYSSLATPWIKNTSTTPVKSVKPSAKQIQAGKALSGPCVSCHGETGNSTTEGIPSLAGLSAKYIATALNSYFKGDRKNEFMKVFRHAFGPDRVASLSAYFSSQKRLPTTLPVKGNVKAGKTIANQRCIGCHGEGGNSFIDEFPTLAGQNEKFLREATLSYRNGKRKSDIMNLSIKGLTETDIKNLAAYYATQIPAESPASTTVDLNDPVQAAAYAARPCYGCHGKDGNSTIAGNPNLSGLMPDYLSNAIVQYQTGDRNHQLMKKFVSDLDPGQLELITIHYASQEPKATTNTGKGNPEKVKDLIGGCEGCHGTKGVSSSKNPSLAGQDAAYLVSALSGYQNKDRASTEMQNAVAEVPKENFNHLAAYFASQAPVKPEITSLQTAEQLAQKCDRCHNAVEPNPNLIVPRIIGQSEAYLLKAINDYKTKARDQSTMYAMLDVLTQWEVSQIARYYSRQKPDTHLNSGEK